MAGLGISRGSRDVFSLLIFWLAWLASLPVCAEETDFSNRFATDASRPPNLFTIPDAEGVFEKDLYPEPGFLPQELYDPHPPIRFDDAKVEDHVPDEEPAIELMQYPTEDSAARDEDPVGHYSEPRWNPFPFLTEQLAKIPPDQRGIVWKETAITATELPQTSDAFGMTVLDFRSTVYLAQLPFIQLTPRYGWRFMTNRGGTDLPSQLYDGGLDVNIFLPLGKRWSFLGTVGPSIFTDGENTTSDAFRMTGRALVFYQWTDTIKLAAGFLYLDRVDIKAIPAGGIFYKPNDRVKGELFFPKPKIGYRVRQRGDRESWIYLAGEFGGGSWAIQRTGGVNDVLTLRDYRLIGGFEHVHGEDYRWLVELGFVFGRKIEYDSGIGTTDQNPTGLIRAGLVF